ncbi:hypothetical protein [Streptomyces sp. NPDC046887]|uniref:hypothetical protein n=1 Tax=Streptomyces sp. NPDC046887 TaxID=3155472 RepID=UPI003405AAF8
MTTRTRRLVALVSTAGCITAGSVLAATPAAAGGVGDFLSPAFGTNCANHHTQPRADGATTADTGTANGNLLGLPVGTALNQCGGADAPSIMDIQSAMTALEGPTARVGDLAGALKIQGVSNALSNPS